MLQPQERVGRQGAGRDRFHARRPQIRSELGDVGCLLRKVDLVEHRGAETAADHARAADYFLEAALTLDQPVPDALAVNARLSAGTNFARAGFRGDARSQFEWLLNNIKDAETLEKTRRELQKL